MYKLQLDIYYELNNVLSHVIIISIYRFVFIQKYNMITFTYNI